MFWRSVNLTGNQTISGFLSGLKQFWRSVNLTGNQTTFSFATLTREFWRSVNLTGNQTGPPPTINTPGFGAVSI